MKKRLSKILSLSITAALLVPTMASAADMQETPAPTPIQAVIDQGATGTMDNSGAKCAG
ncbi:hypothetical protein Q0F98_05905 [Paenibacillus amylolyticus]|nr:hypothetical protein Q0F98_05905 [Paenibacillus amylolyticus]